MVGHERCERARRNHDALGIARGAGGEQAHERRGAAEPRRDRLGFVLRNERVECEVAGLARAARHDHRARARAELRALPGVADRDARVARVEAHRDRWRRERREERNVDGAAAPDREYGDGQVRRLRHQRCDPVPMADAEAFERGGEASRPRRQFAVGEVEGAQTAVAGFDGRERRGRWRVEIAERLRQAQLRGVECFEQFAHAPLGRRSRVHPGAFAIRKP